MFLHLRQADYVEVLSRQTEHALVLAMAAEEAYSIGSQVWAGSLHVVAERSYGVILAGIVDLTNDEADQLEPGVTRLEYYLRRLSPLWSDRVSEADESHPFHYISARRVT